MYVPHHRRSASLLAYMHTILGSSREAYAYAYVVQPIIVFKSSALLGTQGLVILDRHDDILANNDLAKDMCLPSR